MLKNSRTVHICFVISSLISINEHLILWDNTPLLRKKSLWPRITEINPPKIGRRKITLGRNSSKKTNFQVRIYFYSSHSFVTERAHGSSRVCPPRVRSHDRVLAQRRRRSQRDGQQEVPPHPLRVPSK